MKYNLSVNQKAIIDNQLDLSLIEAVLLDVIVYMTLSWDKITKVYFDGKTYFWIDYGRIKEQAPMLGIEKDTIYRHIKSLAQKGFLASHPESQALQKPLYAVMPKAALAFGKNSEPSEKNPNPYGKNSEPPTEKIPYVNTIINNNNINNRVSGDFQSPLPPNQKEEFASFLKAQGLHRLAATNFFLEKEKSCAKKEKYGEDGFLAALARIDEYLAKKPKYLADKKDFGRVLDNFAEPKNLQAAKAAFSAFYSTKYGSPYTTYTKADNNALESILAAIIANVGNDKNIGTDIAAFFAKLGEFAKYQNPLSFKLSFVAADLPAIFAVMRNPALAQARPNGGTMETFRERDKRLIEEEAEEFKRRTFARSQYASQKEIVMRYFERGQAIKPEMLEWQAYKDIMEDRKTAF